MHARMDGEGTLSSGSDALHDDAQDGPPAVLRLTDQTVIQVDFPGEPHGEGERGVRKLI